MQAAEARCLQEHCSLPPGQDGQRQQTGHPLLLQEQDQRAVPQPTGHSLCWPQGLMYTKEEEEKITKTN